MAFPDRYVTTAGLTLDNLGNLHEGQVSEFKKIALSNLQDLCVRYYAQAKDLYFPDKNPDKKNTFGGMFSKKVEIEERHVQRLAMILLTVQGKTAALESIEKELQEAFKKNAASEEKPLKTTFLTNMKNVVNNFDERNLPIGLEKATGAGEVSSCIDFLNNEFKKLQGNAGKSGTLKTMLGDLNSPTASTSLIGAAARVCTQKQIALDAKLQHEQEGLSTVKADLLSTIKECTQGLQDTLNKTMKTLQKAAKEKDPSQMKIFWTTEVLKEMIRKFEQSERAISDENNPAALEESVSTLASMPQRVMQEALTTHTAQQVIDSDTKQEGVEPKVALAKKMEQTIHDLQKRISDPEKYYIGRIQGCTSTIQSIMAKGQASTVTTSAIKKLR